jgi:hypothetical protein
MSDMCATLVSHIREKPVERSPIRSAGSHARAISRRGFCNRRDNRGDEFAAAGSEYIPMYQGQGIPGNRDALEYVANRSCVRIYKAIQRRQMTSNDANIPDNTVSHLKL